AAATRRTFMTRSLVRPDAPPRKVFSAGCRYGQADTIRSTPPVAYPQVPTPQAFLSLEGYQYGAPSAGTDGSESEGVATGPRQVAMYPGRPQMGPRTTSYWFPEPSDGSHEIVCLSSELINPVTSAGRYTPGSDGAQSHGSP